MEARDIIVDTQQSLTLPLKETLIMPINDFHYGGDEAYAKMLKRHLAWGMKHNAYFLGLGDMLDVASTSGRQKLRAAGLFDSVVETLDEAAMKKVREVEEILAPTKGRWLGWLQGHHYWEFSDGGTSDTRICEDLGIPFLGTCAMIRLQFCGYGQAQRRCVIWCHHGAGGGSKQAAPLNKLENLMPYFDADIYLMAHVHKKTAAPIDQLYMDKKGKIQHRTRLIASTGSFYRSYMQGSQHNGRAQGGYVEKALLNPAAIGGIVIRVRPMMGNTRYASKVDINVEL